MGKTVTHVFVYYLCETRRKITYSDLSEDVITVSPITARRRPHREIARRLSRWWDLVPDEVAERQIAWERRHTMWRMRNLAFTLDEIAAHFGISRAAVRWQMAKYTSESPVNQWMSEPPFWRRDTPRS